MGTPSWAKAQIRSDVQSRPAGTLLCTAHFFEDPEYVTRELGVMVKEGELYRVHRGIYWKPDGRLGPSLMSLGLFIADRGAGPAGVSAANLIGVSRARPDVIEIAVSGRRLAAPAGIKFLKRSATRAMRDLNPTEVALLEVLGDWPKTSDVTWHELVDRVRLLVGVGSVRVDKMTGEVQHFPAEALNRHWADLKASL